MRVSSFIRAVNQEVANEALINKGQIRWSGNRAVSRVFEEGYAGNVRIKPEDTSILFIEFWVFPRVETQGYRFDCIRDMASCEISGGNEVS